MTFFGKEKKQLIKPIKPVEPIGPGRYSAQKQVSRQHSCAPFGSLVRKANSVKNNNKQAVGPGSYNISRDILKPNIIQYENQNCIIIKINQQGCSQFKSKQKRFSNKIQQISPGPGTYDYHKSESKVQRNKRTRSVGHSFNKMKQLYQSQYTSKRKPTLVSDKPIQTQQQTRAKSIVKGVLRWDLNKKQRFRTQHKQSFNEEDKSLLIERANNQRKKQKIGNKQSSFFASKSVKSCFDQIIYKSSNPFKIQIRKMLGYEDQSPGPGSYNVLKTKQNLRPSQFQFFGSTVNRFQNHQIKPTVGPGDYQVVPNKVQIYHQRPKRSQKQHRKTFTQLSLDNKIGPGYYNIDVTQKHSHNMKYNNGIAQFGSRQPRFSQQKQQRKQSPQQYVSYMAQQDQQRKKRIQQQFHLRRNALKNKKHSFFASQLKRNCFEDKQPVKNNPFGIYQVGVQDIGTRVKKKQQILQQFAECNLIKPGFLSSVERFVPQKQQPQMHKDCWCQIKQVQKKNIEHMSPAFQSNCVRTEVFQNKNKTPAVGKYYKEQSFIKDSFNSRFVKKNQNKTKKMKIWTQKK